MNHFLGAHIRDYTDLARTVYAAQANPLDQMRDFFTARFIRRTLTSLLPGVYGRGS